MATDTSKELIGLEMQYWEALKARDFDTIKKLTEFPCVVSGPQGVGTIDEDSYDKMIRESNYSLDSYEFKDIQARLFTEDVGVVAYKVDEELIVDGQPVHVQAVDASTWIRKNGSWVCAQHSEAILGDPFGRDRQAPRQDAGDAEESSTVAP